jgi:aminoglycoside 6'-N-acetyltransferase
MQEERLRGARVLLRPFTPDDTAALNRLLAEPEVTRWWSTWDEARVREEMQAQPGCVIEVDGVVAGWVQWEEETEPDYRHVALDMFLGTGFHGQGYATETLRVVIRHFIEAGHHRFTIDPTVGNDAAIRAYSAVGFKPVGVLRQQERAPDGSWRDGLLMDLLADELSEPGSVRCARS